jgi:hypothetical protein
MGFLPCTGSKLPAYETIWTEEEGEIYGICRHRPRIVAVALLAKRRLANYTSDRMLDSAV